MDSIYYVDHRKKSVWVPNFKVGSRTIDYAIGDHVNGFMFRRPRAVMHEYLSYYWVMVTRTPIDGRLRSYWTSQYPKKVHDTYEALVDAILDDGWENIHTVPQYRQIEGLKFPDLCLDLSELTPRWEEVAACFSWPIPMEMKNVSPSRDPLPEYRRDELTEYYRMDFDAFGYARTRS